MEHGLTNSIVVDAIRLEFHSIRGGAPDSDGGNLRAASGHILLPLLPFFERPIAGIQLFHVSPPPLPPPPPPRQNIPSPARPLLGQVGGVRVIAEIILLHLEHAGPVTVVEIGRPELPDSREIIRVHPKVLHLSPRPVHPDLAHPSHLRPRRALLLGPSHLRSRTIPQQILDVQAPLRRRLLQAVLPMVSVVAVRPGTPAHTLVDEVLVVGHPAFLHVEVELPAPSILLDTFLGVSNFLPVTPHDGPLLVLAPAALTNVPLVPVHPSHRKFAQVWARTRLRGAC